MTTGSVAAATILMLLRRRKKKKAIYCGKPGDPGSAVRRAMRELLSEGVDRVIFIFDFDHTLSSMDSCQCHDHLAFVNDDVVREEMRQYLDFANGGHPKLKDKPLGEWWDQVFL